MVNLNLTSNETYKKASGVVKQQPHKQQPVYRRGFASAIVARVPVVLGSTIVTAQRATLKKWMCWFSNFWLAHGIAPRF